MKTKLHKQKSLFFKHSFVTNKRSLCMLLLLTFIIFNSYGNTHKNDKSPSSFTELSIDNDSWVLDTTINNVDFYYKLVTCDNRTAVLLKFDNKNSFDVEVSWKQVVGSKQEPNPTDEFTITNTLVIKGGVTEANQCSDIENALLVVLAIEVNPTFIAEIENFKFSDIIVKEVN